MSKMTSAPEGVIYNINATYIIKKMANIFDITKKLFLY